MVCCRQTTKRLDGDKRKRGGSAPDTICRAANFTLLFRNAIKGTKRRELNARQRSEKHPKGHDKANGFYTLRCETQYFKVKAGLGRKIVRPLQKRADERSRGHFFVSSKINNDETNQTISPRRVAPDGRRRPPEQLHERRAHSPTQAKLAGAAGRRHHQPRQCLHKPSGKFGLRRFSARHQTAGRLCASQRRQ